MIAGVIAFLLSSTQYRNDLKKAKIEREFEMLKEVAEKVEVFNNITLNYWAFITDWRRRLILDASIPKPISLIDIQQKLFDSFSELTKAESLLLLFRYNNTSVKLRKYGETVIAFKKRVESLDVPFDNNDTANYRKSMIDKRSELFILLNEIYKTI
ncbi:hypothetical protein [Psychrobacter urativorans]|uniref:Uncharacterized protein n=1 Tax=Psychrobacter urativorans TaxID=45610 RepID=A0A0M4TEC0_9GAMM|nr:hypothetical protein [Psychrobacter urativorans]ALF59366.1 hypothetical protein AOC03_04280 [Psychrobacter urativorans]